MQEQQVDTRFHVYIDYRTEGGLAAWSTIVPATTMDQAREIAEGLLRKRFRRWLRVDRIVVR